MEERDEGEKKISTIWPRTRLTDVKSDRGLELNLALTYGDIEEEVVLHLRSKVFHPITTNNYLLRRAGLSWLLFAIVLPL